MTLTLTHWLVLGVIALVLVWNLVRRPGRETVRAHELRIIDGDTVWRADAAGNIVEKMRLATISAPETRGLKSLWESRAGLAAKDALAELIRRADAIEVHRLGTDRYGRTLVKLYDRRHSCREIGLQIADAGYARYWK